MLAAGRYRRARYERRTAPLTRVLHRRRGSWCRPGASGRRADADRGEPKSRR